MWRHTFMIFRKMILSNVERNLGNKWYSTKSIFPKSTKKLMLMSAGLGTLIGAGYGGYTHYKINVKRNLPTTVEEHLRLDKAPEYKPHYKVSYCLNYILLE